MVRPTLPAAFSSFSNFSSSSVKLITQRLTELIFVRHYTAKAGATRAAKCFCGSTGLKPVAPVCGLKPVAPVASYWHEARPRRDCKQKPRRYARGRQWTRELGLRGFRELSEPRSCALPIKIGGLPKGSAGAAVAGIDKARSRQNLVVSFHPLP
jgi:hypothetical protein